MGFTINTKLLFIKAHFFLFWAGLATVVPYIPIIGQKMGISAQDMGLLFSLFSFVGLLAKPLFGSLSDHFQKLKTILMGVSIVSTIFYFVIEFLPRDSLSDITPISIRSSPDNNLTQINIQDIIILNLQREVYQINCSLKNNLSEFDLNINSTIQLNISLNDIKRHNFSNWLSVNQIKFAPINYECNLLNNKEEHDIYRDYQFWLFVIFTTISRAGTYVSVSLSDTVCFSLLEEKPEDFGKQRLWGSVGWGLFSFIGGLCIKLASTGTVTNYTPGFYIMLTVYILDIIVIGFLDLKNPPVAKSIWKNVGQLLKNLEIVSFLLAVLAVGAFTGFQWIYFYWYLNSIGATPLLLGIALAIQCFLGEVPFFFITGWVIRKVGHLNAITITLLSFGIRFLLYSFIENPWLILPVELLEGTTFGLFYSVITSYAKVVSPVGTEATIQGLIGGTYDGLGVALGGFLGGIGVQKLGCSMTYRVGSYLALSCCAVHVFFRIAHFIHSKNSSLQLKNGKAGDTKNTSKQMKSKSKNSELAL